MAFRVVFSGIWLGGTCCFFTVADESSWFAEKMFQTVAKAQTTELWMWKMEYLHHEQRPLYFGEWF
eukprot:1287482-Rhodomonas_salina.2